MRASLFSLLALALAAAGCATQRASGMTVLDARSVGVRTDEPGAGTPDWRAAELEAMAGHWQVVEGPLEVPVHDAPPQEVRAPEPAPRAAVVARPPARAAPPARAPLAVPAPRAAPARPQGVKQARSAAELARDHFLDFPTRIEAAKITLHCPAALAGAARLTGEQVDRSRPQRQRAVGGARLVLRELTLAADRITLRIRPAGEDDLQILARGDVRFVSDVRGQVHREEGLRSLLVTNDRTMPLR